MDDEIPNHCLVNRLLHEKNLLVVKLVSEISVKHKRQLLSSLRKAAPIHSNYLFLQFSACTLSEFCTTQVLLSDGKRKFNDFLREDAERNNKKQRS